jgi:hypothetical protein
MGNGRGARGYRLALRRPRPSPAAHSGLPGCTLPAAADGGPQHPALRLCTCPSAGERCALKPASQSAAAASSARRPPASAAGSRSSPGPLPPSAAHSAAAAGHSSGDRRAASALRQRGSERRHPVIGRLNKKVHRGVTCGPFRGQAARRRDPNSVMRAPHVPGRRAGRSRGEARDRHRQRYAQGPPAPGRAAQRLQAHAQRPLLPQHAHDRLAGRSRQLHAARGRRATHQQPDRLRRRHGHRLSCLRCGAVRLGRCVRVHGLWTAADPIGGGRRLQLVWAGGRGQARATQHGSQCGCHVR